MKSKIVLLSIMAISLFGCNGHSSEYSKNPDKPIWGHHYDSVIAAAPRLSIQAQKSSKNVIDTFYKEYDTSVFKYVHVKDSLYTFFYKSDSFRDAKGKPIYDSIAKKFKIYPDTTITVNAVFVQEIKKSAIDTTKIK